MCKAYGQRPSEVLRIEDEVLALDFDLAINMIHRAERDSHIDTAYKEQGPDSALVRAELFKD